MAALDPRRLTASDARWLRALYDPWRWAPRPRDPAAQVGGRHGPREPSFLRDIYRDGARDRRVKGAQVGIPIRARARHVDADYVRHDGHLDDAHRPRRGQVHPRPHQPHRALQPLPVRPHHRRRLGHAEAVRRRARAARWAPARPGLRGPVRSTIYFSGASTEKDAVSMDADLLVHDEEDLSDPGTSTSSSTASMPRASAGVPPRRRDCRAPASTRCSRRPTAPLAGPLSGCNAEFELAFPGGPGRMPTSSPTRAVGPRTTGCAGSRTGDRRGPLPSLRTQPHARGSRRRALGPRGADARACARLRHQPARGALARRGYILLSFRKHPWRSDFWNLTMGIPWDEGTNAFTEAAIRSRCDGTSPMALTGQGCTMGVDVGAEFDVVVGTTDPSGASHHLVRPRRWLRGPRRPHAPLRGGELRHRRRIGGARDAGLGGALQPTLDTPKVSSHIVVWRASYIERATRRHGTAHLER